MKQMKNSIWSLFRIIHQTYFKVIWFPSGTFCIFILILTINLYHWITKNHNNLELNYLLLVFRIFNFIEFYYWQWDFKIHNKIKYFEFQWSDIKLLFESQIKRKFQFLLPSFSSEFFKNRFPDNRGFSL